MAAPILITVYNRPEHFQKCIESIKRCELASESVLYISSDAASQHKDVLKVDQVRKYSLAITGFKKVVNLFQKNNKGLSECFYESIAHVFEESDELIFLEDDNSVSPDFLKYINDALKFYKDDKQVYSISAFSMSVFYPHQVKDKTAVYFTHRFNPWGFGTWKNKFLNGNEYKLADLQDSLKKHDFKENLNNIGSDLYPAFLSALVQRKMLSLDYLNVYHMVKNDLVTATPYQSKSFNTGNDGSGNRTKKSERYSSVELSFLDTSCDFFLTREIEEHIDDSFNRIGHYSCVNQYKIILYKCGFLYISIKINNLLRKVVRYLCTV